MLLLRQERGWSQEELAARAKLHRNYIGSIERSERNVGVDNMEKIAEALEVPLSDMVLEDAG
ncbi:helix-turn-helix domain-containing protein [Deinococcus yunweiensis]|uniref:helix-turn-helix domain-containing protein n=1 Tax=Deinococcus yunweiensis TaxID=367282 RepID=UPI00398E99D5